LHHAKLMAEGMISSCKAARVRKTDSVEASNADNKAVGWN